jgi:hypothetical protein
MDMDVKRSLGAVLAAGLATVALAACGGGGSSATVGACIDGSNKVVDCGSSSARSKLVTDQEKKDAIACIQIGDPPQTEVTVDGHKFCAEPK